MARDEFMIVPYEGSEWLTEINAPASFTFRFGDEHVVTFRRGGVVEVNPAFEADESARKFFDAVRALAPELFK